MMEYKLAVVVREDLDLSKGKLAVQVAHAAVTCALGARKSHPEWFKAWWEEGQRKVVLRVPGLADLVELQSQARVMKLRAEMITDAGLTEVPPGTTTCLGIGPGPEQILDRVTGSLRLV